MTLNAHGKAFSQPSFEAIKTSEDVYDSRFVLERGLQPLEGSALKAKMDEVV